MPTLNINTGSTYKQDKMTMPISSVSTRLMSTNKALLPFDRRARDGVIIEGQPVLKTHQDIINPNCK